MLHSIAIENSRMSFVTNPFMVFDFAYGKSLPSLLMHFCACHEHEKTENASIAYPNKVTQYIGNAKGVPALVGTFVQVCLCAFFFFLYYFL